MLSQKTIQRHLHYFQNGSLQPAEAKQMMSAFATSDINSIDPNILHFLQEAIKRFLEKDLALDEAFAIKRQKAGRPPKGEEKHIKIAYDLLCSRMAGSSFQDAQISVAELHNTSSTQVAKSWKEEKLEALNMLRIKKMLDDETWQKKELKALKRIFKGSIPEDLLRKINNYPK